MNCERCEKLGSDKCHCQKKSKYGPKTKAHHGLKRYKKLTITLPPELWEAIEKERTNGESISGLITSLLETALNTINEGSTITN